MDVHKDLTKAIHMISLLVNQIFFLVRCTHENLCSPKVCSWIVQLSNTPSLGLKFRSYVTYMIQNANLPKKLPCLVYKISLEEVLKAIGLVRQAMEIKYSVTLNNIVF